MSGRGTCTAYTSTVLFLNRTASELPADRYLRLGDSAAVGETVPRQRVGKSGSQSTFESPVALFGRIDRSVSRSAASTRLDAPDGAQPCSICGVINSFLGAMSFFFCASRGAQLSATDFNGSFGRERPGAGVAGTVGRALI